MKHILIIAVLISLIVAQTPSYIPLNLTLASGYTILTAFYGNGTQDYQCQNSTSGVISWVLYQPQATLYTFNQSMKVGIHYYLSTTDSNGGRAGWTYTIDNSTVIGKSIDTSTESSTSIPWLELLATSHSSAYGSSTGLLTNVSYILRLNTTAGVVNPSVECDSTTLGNFQNVSYSAYYYFYVPSTSATTGSSNTNTGSSTTASSTTSISSATATSVTTSDCSSLQITSIYALIYLGAILFFITL